MQDATITQKQEQVPQGRFPSVVTTDDLVFELGKQIVDKLNKEKLLEGLLKKKQQAESQIVDVEKVKAEAKRQIAVFKDSNRQYEENNRRLGDELVGIRKEFFDLKAEKTKLEENYKRQIQNLRVSREEALKPKRKRISKKKVLISDV